GRVRGLGFAPDGRTLVASAIDGTVRLWDVETRAVRTTFRARTTARGASVAFSPDGATLATTSADDGMVRLWDPATGAERTRLRGHSRVVVAVAFAPDGERVAAAGMDGTVRLWRAGPAEAPGRRASPRGRGRRC